MLDRHGLLHRYGRRGGRGGGQGLRAQVLHRQGGGKVGVSQVAVLANVQPGELFRPADADADGVLERQPDKAACHKDKRAHGQHAQHLHAQQPKAAAKEQAVAGGKRGDALLREQADAQRAEHAAAQVHGGRADGVVDMQAVKETDRKHNQHTGDSADEQRAFDADIGAGAGDAHKARQTAVDRHAQVRLADDQPGGDGGGEHGRDGRGVGGDQDVHDVRRVLEAHGGAGVEPEPAQPQDEQANDGQRHVVPRDGLGLAGFIIFADARAQNQRPGQSRPAADRVHGGVPGEIHKAEIGQPAAAPDPVPDDGVDDQREHKGKEDERKVLDALGHRAGDDGGRRAAKHKLEKELAPERHGGSQRIVIKAEVRAAQHKQMLGADEGVVAAEHQPPAQQHKAQRGHGKDDKVFGQDVDAVFGAGKARLHRGKAQVHKEHEDRRQQHPQSVDDGNDVGHKQNSSLYVWFSAAGQGLAGSARQQKRGGPCLQNRTRPFASGSGCAPEHFSGQKKTPERKLPGAFAMPIVYARAPGPSIPAPHFWRRWPFCTSRTARLLCKMRKCGRFAGVGGGGGRTAGKCAALPYPTIQHSPLPYRRRKTAMLLSLPAV